ncbi:hypothetical protein [Bradyrhizobium sp. 180]|uniref:hypothetical protein n=1 Tax=Bradyrhizobium sp. 180 TaxID=2782650 RepID=UPI0031FA0B5D
MGMHLAARPVADHNGNAFAVNSRSKCNELQEVNMTRLHGIYIDHKMTTPFAMAQLSARSKPLAADLARSGIILLATCVRVEAYGEAAALTNVESTIFSGLSYERIEGPGAIARRLAEIASSAHSQILGESYVSHQFAKSIELVRSDFPIYEIARFALDIGRAARERQGFIAAFNYEQIVRDIIADRVADGERPDRLYIIGAGMLGRGLILSGVRERFRSTIVVTRNPKAFRKRLRRYTDIEVALLRPEEIGQEPEPSSIVIIATAEVDDEYQAILQNGLLRLEPRTIVDLSSVPALSDAAIRKLSYVNMYSEEFLQFIECNNRQLAPKLPLLLSDIEETVRAAQIHLAARATEP